VTAGRKHASAGGRQVQACLVKTTSKTWQPFSGGQCIACVRYATLQGLPEMMEVVAVARQLSLAKFQVRLLVKLVKKPLETALHC
jgi:hypothetical protein